MDTPAAIMLRLQDIETELAVRQNDIEQSAMEWFQAKREKERKRAEVFLSQEGTVAERSAQADLETALIGSEAEAAYEARRVAIRVLESRAGIGQSLLKAQQRY